MAVHRYSTSLLSYEQCPVKYTPPDFVQLLKIWRKSHRFGHACTICHRPLSFPVTSWAVCCDHFYYDDRPVSYTVTSIAIRTPGYPFLLPVLKRTLQRFPSNTDQEFLILPDPIYWQVSTTLIYEKVMKFVQGLPMTRKTTSVQPPSKVDHFYNEIMNAPLNYGSLQLRSRGKMTLMRQIIFGKRTLYSMRGMIVPDASLKPNEIRLPSRIVRDFRLEGKWLILNRMPSLQPGNFVGLIVSSPGWDYECIGIPLEVVQAIHGDFDGDECNVYFVPNLCSQAECATLLNPEWNLGCFVMEGPKLSPTQDMLVAYFLRYDEIRFLPYKTRDLGTTFRVCYDLYGSRATFDLIDRMRRFYLDTLQNEICFALTLEEMESLYAWGRGSFESFRARAEESQGCLVTQVKSGAKGSYEHLYQMFGKVGYQDDECIDHCFWEGLNAREALVHAKLSTHALNNMCKIWEPGYGYTKMIFNLQGLVVDYKGRLVDGQTVIEHDVLNALHSTDLMSEESFRHLLEKISE